MYKFAYSVWGIVKDASFYIYTSAIDDEAIDLLDLRDWTVCQTQAPADGHRQYILRVTHQVSGHSVSHIMIILDSSRYGIEPPTRHIA